MTDTKTSLLEDTALEQSDPTQVAELYADRLMDEIFEGVEQALEGNPDALDSPPENAPAPALEGVDFSTGGLPTFMGTTAATPFSGVTLPSDLAVAEATAEPLPPRQRWWQRWTVNRLLLGAAGLSLAATLALWWSYQRQTQAPAVTSAPAPAVPEVAGSPDAEFLEYLRRSLSVIAQDAEAETVASGAIPNIPISLNGGGIGLPPINGGTIGGAGMPGGALPGQVPGQINVIERVYIPYQTGPAAVAPTPTPPGTSSAPLPATPGTPAAPAHTLMGILELGDRSAALFEISGVTQRVYIGERIGSSGWSLVSVTDGEATIRRNGEVRTIYIGQRF
jgi:hypothetical protein